MLGGRYRTCWLRRHWSDDSEGTCRIPGCVGVPGTLLHIATGECLGLAPAKVRAVAVWRNFLVDNGNLFPLISDFSLGDSNRFLEFLVDSSTRPEVIALAQSSGPDSNIVSKLCYMSRTWVYFMHKARFKLLKVEN